MPWEWTQAGVRRYGFHGASHRYIAVRSAELLGRDDLKVISCHIGGSSSICAIDSGKSVANSFGTTRGGDKGRAVFWSSIRTSSVDTVAAPQATRSTPTTPETGESRRPTSWNRGSAEVITWRPKRCAIGSLMDVRSILRHLPRTRAGLSR